jgi:hypothetical protein
VRASDRIDGPGQGRLRSQRHSERTLFRWINDPQFKQAVEKARKRADEATKQADADAAYKIMKEIMFDKTATFEARLRAARDIRRAFKDHQKEREKERGALPILCGV